MTRKTFFLYVTIVLMLLVAYFHIQLNQLQSSMANWCIGEFTWECDVNAQVWCEGGEYIHTKIGSSCNGTTCEAYYQIWCDSPGDGGFIFESNIICYTPGDHNCGGEN